MISAAATNLTNIWSHAKNVRANFIRHSRYEEPAPSTPGYYGFDMFSGGEDYYYYDNENTTDSTTEAPIDLTKSYPKYHPNSDSEHFIDQENIERNHKDIFRLINSNLKDTDETKSMISENCLKNGALIFVFLNSNPNTVRRKYLVELFDFILLEEPFKAILMTNEFIKKSSPVERDITTNFFAKIASSIGFQYNFPTNYDNPMGATKFVKDIEHVQGIILLDKS